MKKIIFSILVILILLSVGSAASYFSTNYHRTPESALEELRQQSNVQVLQLPENNKVFLLDEAGDVSIAFMKVERPFQLYKDFQVFPTSLNVYDADMENEIPYAMGPWYLEYTFGLLKNENVEYTALGSTVRKDNVSDVFALEKELDDTRLKGVKLWYIPSGSTSPEDLKSDMLFLNADKEILEIGKKNFVEKKTVQNE
ncbi:hypothetical protein [uncultured Planococcus sp.]|uniref:hypothetical protein n=1 Tax=uncultured Planococcus sp. TaxID=337815 RepID=UPI002634AB38|nr:hypothetical protein [uncultured Planococcus sp.]